MKTTFLALIAALAPLCASQAHAQARQVKTEGMTTFCRSTADMDQWMRYVVAGDDVAAVSFYEEKHRADACWEEPAGTYTLSDATRGTVGPMECLRGSGFTRCYWTIGVSHMPYNK